jgi:hypothetical protein
MRIILLITVFLSTVFVYSSEIEIQQNIITERANTISIPHGSSLLKYQKSKEKDIHLFLRKHREQLIFTGIGLTAGIISGIFNGAAKSQYNKEKKLYQAYIGAPENSDFDKLWNEYKNAADKTDRSLNLRGIFGAGAGVIGASLLISIIVEGNF